MGTVLPPHVYGLANNALVGMIRDGNNQSVVIRSASSTEYFLGKPARAADVCVISASSHSGESGAGKTEETKLTLQFLAEVAKATDTGGKLGKSVGNSLAPQ